MNIMDPTAEEARKMRALGMPLPRGAVWSEGNEALIQDEDKERLAALKLRVDVAKAKGETLSFSDMQSWEWALEHGLIAPEVRESAVDLITRGLQAQEFKRQDGVAEAMKEIEGIAQEALKARRTVVWSDFRTKTAAVAVNKALQAKFDEAVGRIQKDHIVGIQTSEFRHLAAGHIDELRKCFTEPFKDRE